MKNIYSVMMLMTIVCLPACGRRLPTSVSSNIASSVTSNTTAINTTTAPAVTNTNTYAPQNRAMNTAPYPQQTAYTQSHYSQSAPASVQIRPDLYANPYYPQSYGRRATGPVYPGQVNPNAMTTPNGVYPQSQAYGYSSQNRRAY